MNNVYMYKGINAVANEIGAEAFIPCEWGMVQIGSIVRYADCGDRLFMVTSFYDPSVTCCRSVMIESIGDGHKETLYATRMGDYFEMMNPEIEAYALESFIRLITLFLGE